MSRSRSIVSTALTLAAFATAARADLFSNDFSTNPLLDAAVLKQGPDAANLNSRFTYNNADGTLTAHYDTAAPTVKLVFPLPGGQHLTQDSTFTATTTFQIASAGFNPPGYLSGQAVSFGLVNSATTGSARASTGYGFAPFTEVTPGTAYDIMTLDYFPSVDQTYGGDSLNLVAIQSAKNGAMFNDRFISSYENTSLPFDQWITATISYNAASGIASLNWGGADTLTLPLKNALDPTLNSVFDVDSFAITLWNDPNPSAPPPSDSYGFPTSANVTFDAFSVQSVPEPTSIAVFAASALLLLRRRR